MTALFTPHAFRVGVFFIFLYALCLIWPRMYPYGTDVLIHHLLSLKLLFPGFQGYAIGSIFWGGILSFIYGFIGSFLFHVFHKNCCRGK
ncbi:MAG: hypothetical protein UU48_C0006G0161 [Candidatus Uhrbacteria bacterium GW2011_GWF2_41_16]|jgi:hypothetical protein|uniref:Uncharacterized protein n=2 Tax=Candidatus Uhriibacteriota TaxID=1752732 RepID=A0A0G0VEN7_9BACT|nr:MAG: hypothetical protein UU31_C0002G0019 [Candidatus Uhrbacteria bacterium GW2011_GWA2_41_10]KKR86743.1 MAG: hypothetical protein UU35_C0009G0030 [Candidatus Uhrbacteria bacterium GW2011_GWC2_41_11]KKR98121.1 MAG: hypothetical protein UU48_C0006G0161 [Candidatus Uhrbacteria bacterium GW2011_GWF2_41_16]HBP00347.1 hypothetical protein [Candidatus Uhrbacteria bacterium]